MLCMQKRVDQAVLFPVELALRMEEDDKQVTKLKMLRRLHAGFSNRK